MKPYSLIENYFIEDKTNFKDFKIFEAGFGDLGCTLDFYYRIPFSEYYGVEKFAKNELTISILREDGTRWASQNGKEDEYDKYLNYSIASKQTNKLSRIQFQKTFKIKYEELIEDYIYKSDNLKTKYNLGIFSNVFHKISEKSVAKRIVKWFSENSEESSYLYFKIMKSNKYAYDNIDFIYSRLDIDELISSFNCEVVAKDESDEDFSSFLLQKR